MDKMGATAKAIEEEVRKIVAEFDSGNLELALKKSAELCQHYPNLSLLHNLKGVIEARAGRPVDAQASYQKALRIKPDFFEPHYNLGNLFAGLGSAKRALGHYKSAVRLRPDVARAHIALGRSLRALGHSNRAETCFKKAVALDPGSAEAYNELGITQIELGEREKAITQFEQAISLVPGFAIAYKNLSFAKTFEKGDKEIKAMEKLLSKPGIEDGYRKWLKFALAKAYEDTRDYDKCFSCLEEGNRIRKAELGYDLSTDTALFQNIHSLFSTGWDSVKNLPSTNLKPIFIVGMPRSGTSLVEQILASHSLVYGAGELKVLNKLARPLIKPESPINNQENLDNRSDIIRKLRNSYTKSIEELEFEERIFTDKMPLNFRWIGFLALAFPEAKFVHVERSPIATCWSCYKHHFSQGNGFACDMEDLVAYYDLYQRLMKRWKELYPGRIFDLNYEQLTENQEVETRKLLEYCDLYWEAECLEFHKTTRAVQTASAAQVRETMYTGSSNAWKDFEPHIEPLIDGLTVNNRG